VLDALLLGAGKDGDDLCLKYRRVLGNPRSNVVCYLPWKTPFELAQKLGLVPREFLACYEMPCAIVSSEPRLCKVAMQRLVGDAMHLTSKVAHRKQLTIIGQSMGSAPATVLANMLGARLYSLASADHGPLMLWESPASAGIRERASAKGYSVDSFTETMAGTNPIENLDNIDPRSVFVFGNSDLYVPQARRQALHDALETNYPHIERRVLNRGHVLTMVEGMRALARAGNGELHAIPPARRAG
jgi:pimeloyl-ACP methyl ester carboxylesterase